MGQAVRIDGKWRAQTAGKVSLIIDRIFSSSSSSLFRLLSISKHPEIAFVPLLSCFLRFVLFLASHYYRDEHSCSHRSFFDFLNHFERRRHQRWAGSDGDVFYYRNKKIDSEREQKRAREKARACAYIHFRSPMHKKNRTLVSKHCSSRTRLYDAILTTLFILRSQRLFFARPLPAVGWCVWARWEEREREKRFFFCCVHIWCMHITIFVCGREKSVYACSRMWQYSSKKKTKKKKRALYCRVLE
jgi:hypothetical protein